MDPKFVRVTAQLAPHLERPRFRLTRLSTLLREPISYGTSSRLSVEPPGNPVLRMSNLTEDGWDLAELKYLDAESPPEAWVLERGDVVVNRTNSEELVGKAAVFDLDPGPLPWLYASYLLRLRFDVNSVLPEFIVAFVNSPVGRLQVDRVSRRAVGMANINTSEIGSFVVPLPELADQRRLVERLSAAFAERMARIVDARDVLLSTDGALLDAVDIRPLALSGKRSFAATARQARSSGRLGAQFFHPDRAAALRAIDGATAGDRRTLAELADFISDRCTPGSDDQYIGLSAVEPQTGELLPVADEAADAKRFKRGDVLYGRLRPYLNKVYFAEDDGVCSTEFYVLRPRDGVDGRFLAMTLRSSLTLAQTTHMMTGNTHPRVVEADAKQIAVRLPRPEVQGSVVAVFAARREQALGLRRDAEDAWRAAQLDFDAALLG